MLRADYDEQNCSIARTLEFVGERWSLLILREAFLGTRRFDEFQSRLGIARNVLQSRLERLTEAGSCAALPIRSGRCATSTGSRERASTCGR